MNGQKVLTLPWNVTFLTSPCSLQKSTSYFDNKTEKWIFPNIFLTVQEEQEKQQEQMKEEKEEQYEEEEKEEQYEEEEKRNF